MVLPSFNEEARSTTVVGTIRVSAPPGSYFASFEPSSDVRHGRVPVGCDVEEWYENPLCRFSMTSDLRLFFSGLWQGLAASS
jgi:hypothetical protein